MEVRLIKGHGSRKNRVHVFDRRKGYFICSGYLRDGILFTNSKELVSPFDSRRLTIREFKGRYK